MISHADLSVGEKKNSQLFLITRIKLNARARKTFLASLVKKPETFPKAVANCSLHFIRTFPISIKTRAIFWRDDEVFASFSLGSRALYPQQFTCHATKHKATRKKRQKKRRVLRGEKLIHHIFLNSCQTGIIYFIFEIPFH